MLMAIGNLARCVWVCQPARCALCCVWYSRSFVCSVLYLGCLSLLLCLIFCVFRVFFVMFGLPVSAVFGILCVLCIPCILRGLCILCIPCTMRTLCSGVFGLASSVVGSCVLGGRWGLGSSGGANWGVGEEGCSAQGGGRGLNAIKTS